MKDRKLPALEKAVDNAEMLKVFSTFLPQCESIKLGSIQTIENRILKYKPGKTCVIEYCLYSAKRFANPHYMIGKMYRKNRGETGFHHLEKLWRNAQNCHLPNAANTVFGMAEPIWFEREMGMVFQKNIHAVPIEQCLFENMNASDSDSEGESSHENFRKPLFFSAVRNGKQHFRIRANGQQAIQSVAKNLAALHSIKMPSADVKSLAENTNKFAQQNSARLIADMPEVGEELTLIVNTLCDEHLLQDAPVTPVHGDLNLSQILLENEQAFFIDFDGFCISHSAIDVANLMTILKVKFGEPGAQIADYFHQAYLSYRAIECLPGLNFYIALSYLRRAFICFHQRAGDQWRNDLKKLLSISKANL
ncbi:MAG: aminoglycoside phosphotransferase family protein [bacterium]